MRICSSVIVYAAFATRHAYRRQADTSPELQGPADGAAHERSALASGNDARVSH
jgi:hypothetical protein